LDGAVKRSGEWLVASDKEKARTEIQSLGGRSSIHFGPSRTLFGCAQDDMLCDALGFVIWFTAKKRQPFKAQGKPGCRSPRKI
jgi:hypothetical protein